jgi:hypothetical protein
MPNLSTLVTPSSSITADKLSGGQSGSAPIYGARAWVVFDGTKRADGTTDSSETDRFIMAQGNVSRVNKVGSGEYDIFFTTFMPTSTYCIIGTPGQIETYVMHSVLFRSESGTLVRTVSSCGISHRSGNTTTMTGTNPRYCSVAFFC